MENLWKLLTTIISRVIRLQLIICHEKELLSSTFFYKTRANMQQVELWTGQQVQARTRPEPENISPNTKINLKPKSCPKKSESKVRSEKFSNIADLFLLFFCTSKTKSTSHARIKPDIFVNFRPEPDPKSPARLTTLATSVTNANWFVPVRWMNDARY